MDRKLFATLVAGTLMILQTESAPANESTPAVISRNSQEIGSTLLPLPPIPYVEAVLWATSGWTAAGQKVDMLWPRSPGDVPPWLEQPAAASKSGELQSFLSKLKT